MYALSHCHSCAVQPMHMRLYECFRSDGLCPVSPQQSNGSPSSSSAQQRSSFYSLIDSMPELKLAKRKPSTSITDLVRIQYSPSGSCSAQHGRLREFET